MDEPLYELSCCMLEQTIFPSQSQSKRFLGTFEEAVTSIQLLNHGTHIVISGPCIKLDQHSVEMSHFDASLKQMMAILECRYIKTSASMNHADGDVDMSVFMDDVPLKHTERPIDRSTALPYLCRSRSEPSYRQFINTHRPQNRSNRDRYICDTRDYRDHLDYKRQNPHQ
ncbi:hypothetical protein BSL78_05393 [Apostichopus japonicus]|uniref:Uncharacterized protein n=1 Tax=Stichopus japonicus TaxID=307972 RepID=A0A2G8LBT3_STIJA|nr:hypothetical protein BSL78_05393 [Apostichopus japonicus]